MTGNKVNTSQREDGEDYLRFGLALQENFEGESGFQIAAGFTNLTINEYGGEWQTLLNIGEEFSLFTELYQPIDYKNEYYVYANTKGGKVNRNILSDNDSQIILGQARISEVALQIGGGRNFGRWGTLRAGLKRAFGGIKGRIGFPGAQNFSYDNTTLITEFLIDTLDNTQFPTSGTIFQATYENNISLLGGDSNVDTITIGSYTPFSWGKNTLGFRTLFATAFNGSPDETNLFPLGGFMGLSAFSPGQLTGNHGGVITAIYYRRISGGPQYLAEMPLYIGGTIETGNVWNNRDDIGFNDLKWSSSAFVGIDSILGPTYLGLGLGSQGATSVFLNVGQIF
ncbi:MAG: BamA/TamA family outer membrane protein [Emcibacteraceae bacterium]|nr:BamA/TamA family outer membrane protein [Emcibacteraceae bacterium]